MEVVYGSPVRIKMGPTDNSHKSVTTFWWLAEQTALCVTSLGSRLQWVLVGWIYLTVQLYFVFYRVFSAFGLIVDIISSSLDPAEKIPATHIFPKKMDELKCTFVMQMLDCEILRLSQKVVDWGVSGTRTCIKFRNAAAPAPPWHPPTADAEMIKLCNVISVSHVLGSLTLSPLPRKLL